MLEKLKDKGYLVLDGAMGSNLFLLGLISGDSPEAWNLEHPDRVKKVHQAFVQAGSDIILTNTFGGNRHRLKLHQLENQVVELSLTALLVDIDAEGLAQLTFEDEDEASHLTDLLCIQIPIEEELLLVIDFL